LLYRIKKAGIVSHERGGIEGLENNAGASDRKTEPDLIAAVNTLAMESEAVDTRWRPGTHTQWHQARTAAH